MATTRRSSRDGSGSARTHGHAFRVCHPVTRLTSAARCAHNYSSVFDRISDGRERCTTDWMRSLQLSFACFSLLCCSTNPVEAPNPVGAPVDSGARTTPAECPNASDAGPTANLVYRQDAVPRGRACSAGDVCRISVHDCASDWPFAGLGNVSTYECRCTNDVWNCTDVAPGTAICPFDAGDAEDAQSDADASQP